MIYPWIRGFLALEKAPMAWTLALMNVFMFMLTWNGPYKSTGFYTSDNIELTGILYFQLTQKSSELPPRQEVELWGLRALRNEEFLDLAETYNFPGDQIAIARWKEDLKSFRDRLKARPLEVFGFNFSNTQWGSLLTYQFMHAGWLHLLGNVLMLLLFAATLETYIGSLSLLLLYLFGGFAAAAGFLLLGSASLAPMVGASGSLSAIISFYVICERRKHVRFFYFLSPFKDYWGWIYLPTWIILPLTFSTDLASYLSSTEDLGSGVAYTAHIGGALFGLMCAYIYKILKLQENKLLGYFR